MRADGTTLKRHPCVSSVFYLDDVGGGTAVFGQTRHWGSCGVVDGALTPALPSHVAVAFPKPNQLLLFQGDRLHAGGSLTALAHHPQAGVERERR